MGKQNQSRSKSQSQDGKKGKNNNNSSNKTKKTGTISIEKLMFATGDNQAENFQRIRKHLANEALGTYGDAMAHILLNEAEFKFTPPTLRVSTALLSSMPTEPEKAEKARQNRGWN